MSPTPAKTAKPKSDGKSDAIASYMREKGQRARAAAREMARAETGTKNAALFALRAGVPTVLMAASPYYEAKAGGLAELAGVDRSLVGDDLELGARLDRVAKQLDGSPLAAAIDRVETWRAEALGYLLSESATPTNGHTSGSSTGGGGVGRIA